MQHGIMCAMMRRYEAMMVLAPSVDTKDTKKLEDMVRKFVGNERIAITDISVMGKKRLAYPLRKYTEGVYVVAELEAPTLSVADIQRRAKLGDYVIRFLLTVKK